MMRDRTRRRNYSPQAEQFRRQHERHRAWGLERRHAECLRRLRGAEPDAPTVSGAGGGTEPPQAGTEGVGLALVVSEFVVSELVASEAVVSGLMVSELVVSELVVSEVVVSEAVASEVAKGERAVTQADVPHAAGFGGASSGSVAVPERAMSGGILPERSASGAAVPSGRAGAEAPLEAAVSRGAVVSGPVVSGAVMSLACVRSWAAGCLRVPSVVSPCSSTSYRRASCRRASCRGVLLGADRAGMRAADPGERPARRLPRRCSAILGFGLRGPFRFCVCPVRGCGLLARAQCGVAVSERVESPRVVSRCARVFRPRGPPGDPVHRVRRAGSTCAALGVAVLGVPDAAAVLRLR